MSRGFQGEHLITPEEAETWLADSMVTSATYHRTTRAAAQDIFDHGVDPERSVRGAYGQGFYTSNDPEAFPGDAIVTVAIKLRHPLIGSVEEIERVIDALSDRLRPQAHGRITREVARAVRLELVDLGYDGIVIADAGGDGVDYVVALARETVKVVIQP